ncbi:MAG: universal stress protein [Rickettsiales bacterium]|jgi:nucleotide-binding universal stress UspA family protein|nr:universal stress protein [Rickettsiales bacterium]
MYKNILYPVDIFDESSWQSSLPIVKEYCATFDAKLHVMTAIPDYGMAIVSQYFPKGSIDTLVDKTKQALHEFVEKEIQNNDIVIGNIIVSKGGAVYQSIIDTAEKINSDLIMISAHRPELKDYLLGPNSAKVVRHSKISVLVMRY